MMPFLYPLTAEENSPPSQCSEESSPIFERLEQRLMLDGTGADGLFDLGPALFVENQGQWADAAVR